jgi:hypothetical protein
MLMALGANPGNENGPDIYCRLPTADCPLPTAHCPLPTIFTINKKIHTRKLLKNNIDRSKKTTMMLKLPGR